MDLLINIIAFIFALGIIIFIHELGHLLVAKAFDVRVKTFSLGFGKRLWGFERGETDYRVSLVPLGGYVALGGENPEDSTGDPREFLSKPRWQRILVYVAGPAMNVVLSVLLIALLFTIGFSIADGSGIDPVVGEVEEGSSAARAGLQPGDEILAVGGQEVDDWKEIMFELISYPERPVALAVQRGEERFTATVTPSRIPKYELGDTAGLVPQVLPQINQVVSGAPAEAAGFEAGDVIRTVDGRPMADVVAFTEYIAERPGQEITIEVVREEGRRTLSVVPEDQGGTGRIGVGVGYAGVFRQYGLGRALVASVEYNLGWVRQIGDFLGKLLTRELSAKAGLAGPIEIAAQSGNAARRGFGDLLHFVAFISINIGLLNLMPIPILDGGQILILLIESVIRRDLSFRVKELVAQVGFVLIMLLMLTVIWFDISRHAPDWLIPG